MPSCDSLSIRSTGSRGIRSYPGPSQYAMRYGLTVYDAAFLSAATLLGVELITADRVLHRKVAEHLPWVKLLHELPVSWP